MIHLLLVVLLGSLLPGGPGPESAGTDSAVVVSSTPDSNDLAKLEAVQKAWDEGNPEEVAGTSPAPQRGTGSAIARIVASLSVLLGLAGLALMLVRKLRRGPSRSSGTTGPLDLLLSKPLGHGNHLTLVRVHDRVLVVGHGPGGVSTLAEFRDHEAASVLSEMGDGAVLVRDFTQTLDTFLDRFRGAPPSPPEGGRS